MRSGGSNSSSHARPHRAARRAEAPATKRDLRQAEEHLAKRMIELREAQLYGLRETRTFRAAATRYLQDYAYNASRTTRCT